MKRDITKNFLIGWSTDGTCWIQRTPDSRCTSAPGLNAFNAAVTSEIKLK